MSVAVRLLGSWPVSTAATFLTTGRLRILAYHGIPDRRQFARQLDEIAARYQTVTGPVVAAWLDGRGDLPGRPVWITFDDGRPEVMATGAGLLAERDMTATCFVCPGLVGTSQPYWWDVVEDAVTHGVVHAEDLGVTDRIGVTRRMKEMRDSDRRRVVDLLTGRLHDIGQPPERPQLTSDDLQQWLAAGHEIGNHSWDHPCLDRCSEVEQRSQIERAHDALTSHIGAPPLVYAWPNGNAVPAALEKVRELGYRLVLTFDHRLCRRRPEAMAMSRLRVDSDADLRRFRAIISGAHSAVFHVAKWPARRSSQDEQ